MTDRFLWRHVIFEVTCVTTDSGSAYNDCRCIKTIGYRALNTTVTRTPAQIHNQINNGTDFYIMHKGSKTYLEAVGSGPNRYVRTESNDTSADNLLSQPSC